MHLISDISVQVGLLNARIGSNYRLEAVIREKLAGIGYKLKEE